MLSEVLETSQQHAWWQKLIKGTSRVPEVLQGFGTMVEVIINSKDLEPFVKAIYRKLEPFVEVLI